MPNINAFKVVVHEKKIFKGFCYIKLWPYVTPGTLIVLGMLHVKYCPIW